MKKYFIIGLILVLVVGLTGCGGSKSKSSGIHLAKEMLLPQVMSVSGKAGTYQLRENFYYFSKSPPLGQSIGNVVAVNDQGELISGQVNWSYSPSGIGNIVNTPSTPAEVVFEPITYGTIDVIATEVATNKSDTAKIYSLPVYDQPINGAFGIKLDMLPLNLLSVILVKDTVNNPYDYWRTGPGLKQYEFPYGCLFLSRGNPNSDYINQVDLTQTIDTNNKLVDLNTMSGLGTDFWVMFYDRNGRKLIAYIANDGQYLAYHVISGTPVPNPQ